MVRARLCWGFRGSTLGNLALHSTLFNPCKGVSPGRMGGKIHHLSVLSCRSLGINPALTKLDLPEPEAPNTTVKGLALTKSSNFSTSNVLPKNSELCFSSKDFKPR